MSSSPQVQTQEPNQDQTQEPNQDQTQEPNQDQNQDNTKEEVKAEEKEEKKEEKQEKKDDKKEANEAKMEKKKEEKQDSWKDFIYNPRTGEFLGRTAGSWGKRGGQRTRSFPDSWSLFWPGLTLLGSVGHGCNPAELRVPVTMRAASQWAEPDRAEPSRANMWARMSDFH